MLKRKTNFIFVTGGVVSSLGKGVTTAALAALLQDRGYSVRMKKLDPYLNIDPGTMSPYQHGEVFVTDDGVEADLDLGHYERFTGISATSGDSITSGKIYSILLERERSGYYAGKTVQVIPHVTNIIKEFILRGADQVDFMLCEIGGTVGDIEALPYFEAIRQLGYELNNNQLKEPKVIYIHLTLVPYLQSAKELKTKPTQHSVKELRSIGIQPNILVCRAERKIPKNEIEKIGLFCNVEKDCVIQAQDCDNINKIPLIYRDEGLDKSVLKCFNLDDAILENANLAKWRKIANSLEKIANKSDADKVKIAIVGKYNELRDAYKSLIEAFEHASIFHNAAIELVWIDADTDEFKELKAVDGVMVPGGFGTRGVNGKLAAIEYARSNNVPFFGICFGMQLAIIEYARNVIGIKDSTSEEFIDENTKEDLRDAEKSQNSENSQNNEESDGRNETNKDRICIIAKINEWSKEDKLYKYNKKSGIGGTLRLGAYEINIVPQSKLSAIYDNSSSIYERHRHRYEFNVKYRELFDKNNNIVFSAYSKDNPSLVEAIELQNHPYFVAVQFHPEFKSRPFSPHPLFIAFLQACIIYHNK